MDVIHLSQKVGRVDTAPTSQTGHGDRLILVGPLRQDILFFAKRDRFCQIKRFTKARVIETSRPLRCQAIYDNLMPPYSTAGPRVLSSGFRDGMSRLRPNTSRIFSKTPPRNEGVGIVEEGGGTDFPVSSRVKFTGPYDVFEDGVYSESLALRKEKVFGDPPLNALEDQLAVSNQDLKVD
jgi:hypothetical protein